MFGYCTRLRVVELIERLSKLSCQLTSVTSKYKNTERQNSFFGDALQIQTSRSGEEMKVEGGVGGGGGD